MPTPTPRRRTSRRSSPKLGVADAADKLIEVWNKVDQLDGEHRAGLGLGGPGGPIAVSALTGEGIDELSPAIEAKLAMNPRWMHRVALRIEERESTGR